MAQQPQTGCFEHPVTVRFHEVDRAGIAFFGRAFEYSHAAFEELLGALGLEEALDGDSWRLPLVSAEADFAKPMRMGDRLCVELAVEQLDADSVTLRFVLRGPHRDDVRATVRHVHAAVDAARYQPITLPRELADGLARLSLIRDEG